MGCTSTISGCILVLINIVFFLIGLFFAAIGGIMYWAPHILTQYAKTILINIAKGTGISDTDIEMALDQIFSFLGAIALVIFVLGLVFVFISLLAMCGVCCKSKCIIGTYAVIVGIIAAAVIALTIVLFVKPDLIEDFGEQAVKKFVIDTYEGTANLTQINGVSGILDLIQISYQCCGVTNYTDFYEATKWNRQYVVMQSGQSVTFNLTIPISCCNVTLPTPDTATLQSCVENPNEMNSNMYIPCYDKLWEDIRKYWNYVQYGFIGCSALLVVLVIIAICATRYDDEKINPI